MNCLLVIAVGLLGILAVLVLSAAAHGDDDARDQKRIISQDNEIYDTQEASDLVAEARKFDPMFCTREQVDRDKAALLYERAITAQPGAKLNATLADRIAQLYAFYEDKGKWVTPNRALARQWWNRCIKFTNPNQFLWAQAQMGLASMAVIDGDYLSALRCYDKILNMDISKVELPDWKVWPDGNTERGKAVLKQEQTCFRESVGNIQVRAAEKKIYALSHISKSAVLDALQDMASRYKGTMVGDKATKVMADIRSLSAKDPWVLSDNFLDVYVPEPKPKTRVQKQEPQKIVAVEPIPLTVTKSSSWNYWGFGVTAFAIIAAAIVAIGIIWIRRSKRLP